MAPKGASLWYLSEAEDLLDAAVAIGRHDEDGPAELVLRIDPQQQVVMELSLLPVVEDFVATESLSEVGQQGSEPKSRGKILDHHNFYLATGKDLLACP